MANADVREKLAQLGVATTDAAGNMLEVSEVLRNLGNAIRDMPRAQHLSIMNELFGKRAVAGGIKLTAASFDRLNEAIDQAQGTARRTAETMDGGIGGALRRLWSAVEGVAIGIGESLAGAISDLADSPSRARSFRCYCLGSVRGREPRLKMARSNGNSDIPAMRSPVKRRHESP